MTSDVAVALAQLSAAMDAMPAVDLDALSDADVLEAVRAVEVQVRRVPSVEHRLVDQVDRRGLAFGVSGEISARHAGLVTATIDKVPAALDAGDTVAQIETFLVEQARQFAPDQLAKTTRHLLDVLDPDGTLKDSDYRDRHRTLEVQQRPDGSVFGRFDGTAEFGELLLTLLDVTAAPEPAQDGERDDRRWPSVSTTG